MKKFIFFAAAALLSHSSVKAQAITGTINVPSVTYPTLASAITALNTQSISGNVYVDIAAGYTEVAPVNGYSLTVSGTLGNALTFEKTGVGANPQITAYAGGVGTPTTALQDGMFRLIGCDYITIDGLDLVDGNTTNPSTMEFGYGFFKASTSNGCQNNTIKNCNIKLSVNNNAGGSSPAVDGSRGIDVVNALSGAHTTALTGLTLAGASNSNNKFYNNIVQNCNIGIALIGFADVSPFTAADQNNDIGGLSAATSNTIINFGGAPTATNAAAAVRTLAQYALNVSYNVINNNNGSGTNHPLTLRGIYLNTAASANATVSNNTITVKGGGTTSQVAAIENASGSTASSNTISIASNLITNCTYGTATSGVFYGIYNNGASPSVLSIINNTFTANSTGATSGSYYNIYNSGSVAGNMNINNNSISGITLTGTSSSLTFRGIYSSSAGASSTVTINSNSIQTISYTGATPTGEFTFIYNGGTSAINNISNNTPINISVPTSGSSYIIYNSNSTPSSMVSGNYVTGSYSKTGAGGSVYGYYNFGSPGSGTTTITGNNFSNLNMTGATTLYGMFQATGTGQVFSVTTNTISNLVSGASTIYGIYASYGATGNAISSNSLVNFTGAASVYGINIGSNASSTSLNINNNAVNSFSSTGASASVYGYYQQTGGTTNMFKNKIYDLVLNNAAGTVIGINVISGTTNNIYDNLIGDLKAPTLSAANGVIGISLTGGTTENISFNSVYLNASSTGANFGTSAISVNGTPTTINLRSNIFANNSTANGTGFTVAYRRSSTILTNYGTASNNNLFYAGTPGTSRLIMFDGTNSYQTLAAYKTAVSPMDAASITENPPFVSTVGSSTNFLNINSSTPTQIESGGTPVSGITVDYAGTTRNATSPDIGAWEGNFTFADFAAPSLVSSGFTTSACILSGRTFTANISDASGVASGSLSPRVYYKINGGSYASVAGTLTSGTANNGVWTFNLTYSANSLDVISYYLVAQDVASTPNLGATPSAGFAGTDVNTITTPPTAPNSYIVPVLNGVYTVGSAGTFTSLTQAASIYNQACLTGAVTFSLTDALYSTAETFPIVFNNNPDASPINSLLIIPAAGASVSVNGSASASSVFKFLNARYITVDGLNTGGSALTFSNANTGASSVVWLASTTSTGPGSNNIGIKNITAIGGGTISSSSFGIVAGVDGAAPSTTSGMDNDNITIQGNTILKCYYGIYASGTAATNAGGLNNWTVNGNQVGPVSSSTNNIGYTGMYFQNAVGAAITSNTVSNVITASGYLYGINLNSGVSTATLSHNVITSVQYVGTGGYGGVGISLDVNNAASGIVIKNNMLSNIGGDGYSGFTSGAVSGIRNGGSSTTGGVSYYYNTIALNQGTTVAGYSTSNVSAAIYFGASSTAIDLRDNILYSSVQYTNTGSKTYAIYSAAPSTAFTNINYNDYSVGGTQGIFGNIGGTDRTTLTQIQSGFGGNVNSMNVTPVFTSQTDLHLIPASNVSLDNLGTPIAGVTTDIDNQTRNTSTPDMGADEFTSPVCTTANGGTITTTSLTACEGQTLSLTSNGASTGINTVYQWMYSTTPGGSYTAVGGGTGANTTSYITPTLSAGVYYVVLQAQCTSASLTAISNEATVTVNSNPTVAVSPLSSTICMPGGSSVGLTATGANSYTWSPSSGITGSGASVNAMPGSTTVYTVTGNNAAGCTAKATATVVISQYPVLSSAAASPATVCLNGTSTLQAIATLTTYGVMSIPYAAIPTPSSGVTTLCNNGTALVPLTSGSLDDGGWTNQTLPFTFKFFGTNYSSFAVSTNGFIFLGAGSPGTYSGYNSAFPSTTAAKPSIGAVYGDLDFDGVGSNSTINYFISGTSPNQKLVVNWSGEFYNNTGTVTTQAILYQTSNIIEVHTFTSTGVKNSVLGIQNAGGTSAFVAPGRNAVLWPVSVPDAYQFVPHTLTYSWSPSTFLSSTNISNPVASNITSTNVYSLNVSGSNGCATSTTLQLSMDNPTMTIAGPTVACSGNTITLAASGANTYSWNTGSTLASINDAPTNTTSYTVTGTNTLTGCSNSAVQSVSVNALPSVSIASVSPICVGNAATLTASGASTYTWNTTATTASIVDNPTVTTTYTVNGTDANGCSNTAAQTITVNNLPVVSMTGTTAICDGATANLTANGASTYSWSNGSTGANVSVSPSVATTYTVTGTDANNCSNTAIQMVTVNPTPTITVAGGAICTGDSFTLTPSGASTYTFSSGPVVTPSVQSTYSVTGTDALGCVSASAALATVSVNAVPSINISGNQAICSGNAATLTASGASTYTWNTTATSASIVDNPTVTTTYSVTGTDANGCSNSAAQTITVNSLPIVSITGTTAICDGATANLTANGASSYSWNTGAITANIAVSPSVSTSYTVTGTDANNCSNTAVQMVSVNANPTITVAGGAICIGDSFTLTPSGASTYTFSTGSVVSPTIQTTYSVTGTDALGCVSANAGVATVTVNALPSVNISGSQAICSGQTATLTASGASSYTWNTNATSASITDSPASTTTYIVNGTDANGCSNTAMQTVTVNSLPVMSVTGSTAICDGSAANLTASGASTYSWNTGATGASYAPTPSVTTSYTVTGTDNNNCSDSISFMVIVNANPTVTAASGAICPGGSFTLAPAGASTYTYLPNGPVVSPGSTTTYSIFGTDGNGCVSQLAATAVVTVTNNLSVTVTGNAVICAGQSTSLTAGGAATYLWSNGVVTSTVLLTPTVNTTYSVTGSSGSCNNTALVTITVNALPVVSLAASSTTLCDNGQTVTLTGSPAGGVYSGSNVSGNIFTSTSAGTFVPVYSFTNTTTGCSNSANATLVVSICTEVSKNTSGLTGLQVYPNPNLGEFVVELNNGAIKNIEVSDVTGRMILSEVTSNDKMAVNISNLANGVYFVKVQSNNSVEVVRVIKQ